MKKINILSFFTIILLGLSFTSCEKYLEEENLSNVTAEDFYTTADGFSALVNSNYSELRSVYGQDPYLFIAGTDLYGQGRGTMPEGLMYYTELNPSSSGVDQLYNSCYTSIQAANQAISFSERTEKTSALTNQIGEVRFLRANAYFLLVQTYGGVPLVTEPLNEPVLEFSRSSEADIYNFIISELEQAANEVLDGAYTGQVNKRAVNNLLGKVHLTRGYESYGASDDFSKAASLFDGVIGGQGLTITPEDLWTPGNESNEEVIFSVQYDAASVSADPFELGNSQSVWYSSYLGGSEVAGNAPLRSYSTCPTNYAIGLYTQDDLRWGSTFMSTIYDRYFDYYDVADLSSLGITDYYPPAWASSEADSIAFADANPGAAWHAYGTYGSRVASLDYGTIPVKKFDDPTAPFGGNTSTRDIIIARLGETYLAAAEAHMKAGDAGTGLDRLNEVRARAGVPAAEMADFDIEYILDERARELLGEYYRWFDLKRTGTLVERASAHIPDISPGNFDGNGGNLKILRPIPQRAIDLNQNRSFEQNPAYN